MAVSLKNSSADRLSLSVRLLSGLIGIPSFSKQEKETADFIENFFTEMAIQCHRKGNNVWVRNASFQEDRPTLLLNSHHDTVKPNAGYTMDPFSPVQKEGRIYGLGSNDAGGPLVAMIVAFLYFYEEKDLPCNLVMAATAEEEISGLGGVESILKDIGDIDFGMVGEPTSMEIAESEKGLMVLDCHAVGQAGHAARKEGINSIYLALDDIKWFQEFEFPKQSKLLGPIHMSVTMIDAGTQHNVIPDSCHFVVDVRTTDAYSNLETLEMIRSHVRCDVQPRSTRLQPSRIADDHPLVTTASQLGIQRYGSPTLSDQALMSFPTIKMGPGDSSRSHSADEYIYLEEISKGIEGYIRYLNQLFTNNLAT